MLAGAGRIGHAPGGGPIGLALDASVPDDQLAAVLANAALVLAGHSDPDAEQTPPEADAPPETIDGLSRDADG